MPFLFSRSPRVVPVDDRDYPEWRRGRGRYGIWMVEADTAPVRERVAQVRHELGGVLSPHRRSPHVTLFVCGFLADSARLDDDFDGAMLASHRAALIGAALAPFRLEIGGIDSFDSAVFLRVSDPAGALARMRQVLEGACPEVCPGRYEPHVTVGLYSEPFLKRELCGRLAAVRRLTPIELIVQQIAFATYEARRLDSRLEIQERMPLCGGPL